MLLKRITDEKKREPRPFQKNFLDSAQLLSVITFKNNVA